MSLVQSKLKNDLLTSLLIKFVCRYLPYEPKESESRDLFQMLLEKNMNLPEEIQKDLQEMKNKFGATLKDAIDITTYFVKKLKVKQRGEQAIKAKDKEEEKQKEEKKDKNEIVIDEEEQVGNEETKVEAEDPEEDSDREL